MPCFVNSPAGFRSIRSPMDETAHGIILRTRPLTETSLIVHWLTADHGRLSTVAKGAKRLKSPFRGKLDLFFEGGFSFGRSRKSDLHTLREVKVTTPHSEIRTDLPRLQLLAYTTRFIERTTEPDNPLPGIHAILTTLLTHLDTHPARPALVYSLEMKLLNELGLAPALEQSPLDEATQTLLEQMSILNWQTIITLQPTKAQAEAVKIFLHDFLLHQLGKLPKGRETALEMP